MAQGQTTVALRPATSMRESVPRGDRRAQSARAARYNRRHLPIAGDIVSGNFTPTSSTAAGSSIDAGSHHDVPRARQPSSSDTEANMAQSTVDGLSDQAQTPLSNRSMGSTYIKDSELLKPGKKLQGILILHILRRAAQLNPSQYVILDPIVSSGAQNERPIPSDVQEQIVSSGKCSIIAPIHLADKHHWVLLRFDRLNDIVHVHDSLSPAHIDGQVRAFILLLITTLKIYDQVPVIRSCHCSMQVDEADSGVAVIVNALDTMTGKGRLGVYSNKNYAL